MPLVVRYIFRHPRKGFFSMEELFNTIINHLPKEIKVERFTLPYPGSGGKSRIKNLLSLKRNSTQVNHVTGDVNFMAFGLNPKTTIVTIHDVESFLQGSWLKNKLIWLLWLQGPLFLSRYVTVISEATRDVLLKKIFIKAEKIKVIPNCISPNFTYYPKEFQEKMPRILHLGTKENKNLEGLIQALEGMPCHLRIIGKLNQRQEKLLIDHNVCYSNQYNLTAQGIVAEYINADLLSFVSYYEGFGMPIIEAQATGRPVITSNLSSMPEVAGDAALQVNPYKVEEIKEGILRLFQDADLRQNLIRKGLENVKRFQPAVIAEQYAALYREILEEQQ